MTEDVTISNLKARGINISDWVELFAAADKYFPCLPIYPPDFNQAVFFFVTI
jgi:hypothetical protein